MNKMGKHVMTLTSVLKKPIIVMPMASVRIIREGSIVIVEMATLETELCAPTKTNVRPVFIAVIPIPRVKTPKEVTSAIASLVIL